MSEQSYRDVGNGFPLFLRLRVPLANLKSIRSTRNGNSNSIFTIFKNIKYKIFREVKLCHLLKNELLELFLFLIVCLDVFIARELSIFVSLYLCIFVEKIIHCTRLVKESIGR